MFRPDGYLSRNVTKKGSKFLPRVVDILLKFMDEIRNLFGGGVEDPDVEKEEYMGT